MRKITLLIALLLFSTVAVGQRLKGSKAVTITQKEIGEFDTVEVSDNLEVFLVKGDKAAVEIEADDNLHDAVGINLSGGFLKIEEAQEVTGARKFSVRITYTDNLKIILARGKTKFTALNDIQLNDITIKTFDNAQFFATVKGTKFVLMAGDKSKLELNVTSDNATVELSTNSQLKALIAASKLTFDMYQKSVATIEGDATDMKLRLDNNAKFTGKNFNAKNAQVMTEDYTNCSIMISASAVIAAGGKSEILLYGEPKIQVDRFADSAILQKKPLKS